VSNSVSVRPDEVANFFNQRKKLLKYILEEAKRKRNQKPFQGEGRDCHNEEGTSRLATSKPFVFPSEYLNLRED
jgi:hypothetical protein